MMKKMAVSCKILNDILRDPEKYNDLKNMYQELEANGKCTR